MKAKRVIRSRSHLYRTVGALVRGELGACEYGSRPFNRYPNTLEGRRRAFRAAERRDRLGFITRQLAEVTPRDHKAVDRITGKCSGCEEAYKEANRLREAGFSAINARLTEVLTKPNHFRDGYVENRREARDVL